jgi:hypothetical protein
MNKPILWFALVATTTLVLAQEAVNDWAGRFSRWTAIRDADAPVRNGFHIRQTLNLTNTNAFQTVFYTVPENRRLMLEQASVYCNFGAFSATTVNQLHVSTTASGAVARYPIARTSIQLDREFLGAPLRLYADSDTRVIANLVFSNITNAVCELSATGQLVLLAP